MKTKVAFRKGTVEMKTKYSWHVKWRQYNPISWLLCWLFEHYSWAPGVWAYDLHDFFCPVVQEAKEEWDSKKENNGC